MTLEAPQPTNSHSLVFESIARAKDPARKMFGARTGMILWGLFNVGYATFFTIARFRGFFGGFGWAIDFFLPITCLMHILAGSAFFKLPIRMTVAAFFSLLLFCWILATGVLVHADYGRTLGNTIGWQAIFVLNYVLLLLSLDQTIYLGPESRKWVRWIVLAVLAFSGLVGMAQLVGIGAARRFFESMENTGLFRPNGTTDYPSQLGFQGFAGMIVCGAPLVRRDLKWIEWAAVGFFGMILLVAQYRSLYYAGFVTGFLPLIYLQFRRNKSTGVVIITCLIAALAVPIMLFPKKFEYGMRGASNDPALQARQEAWKQIGPILEARPYTGIGADPNLMLSAGINQPDKWSALSLDNFYFMIITCFGIVGAVITFILLILMMGGLVHRLNQASGEVKEWRFMAVWTLLCILIFSLTGNSFVYHVVGFFFVAIVAAGSYTWKEELEQANSEGLWLGVRKSFSPNRYRKPEFDRTKIKHYRYALASDRNEKYPQFKQGQR